MCNRMSKGVIHPLYTKYDYEYQIAVPWLRTPGLWPSILDCQQDTMPAHCTVSEKTNPKIASADEKHSKYLGGNGLLRNNKKALTRRAQYRRLVSTVVKTVQT